jgi:uncharacterized membrane protein
MKKEIIGVITLLVLDIIWVIAYMGERYKVMIPKIQCGTDMETNIPYAALSYLLMVIGLLLFVLPNIRKSHLIQDSLLYGAVFGLVLYGVYDLTAAAVIKDWDMKLAAADMAWGAFVMFAAAVVGGYFQEDDS